MNEKAGLSAFPDIFVRCGDRQPDQKEFADPVAIVEVLSPSTRAKDLTTKASAYRTIPSLSRYMVVDQEAISVTLQTRAGDSWASDDLSRPDDIIAIYEIGLSITLAEIYAGVVGIGGT